MTKMSPETDFTELYFSVGCDTEGRVEDDERR